MSRRIRIRTMRDLPKGALPKGQDVIVEVVDEHGNAERLEGVLSVHVHADSRTDKVYADVRLANPHIDMDALALPHEKHARTSEVGLEGLLKVLFVGRYEPNPLINEWTAAYNRCLALAPSFDVVIRPSLDRLQQYRSLSWMATFEEPEDERSKRHRLRSEKEATELGSRLRGVPLGVVAGDDPPRKLFAGTTDVERNHASCARALSALFRDALRVLKDKDPEQNPACDPRKIDIEYNPHL